VLDHLPERDRPAVKRRLRAAWKLSDHRAAIDRLEALAGELAHSHPGAAASLREGLTETVTLQRLGVHQQLHKSLSSTNPIESMIAICRATSRNVKRWQNGDMCLRWTAAGMLEAERQFRKIIGYKHLAALALAVERDVTARRAATSRSITPPTDPTTTTEPAATLAAAH
jgi:putative transposase